MPTSTKLPNEINLQNPNIYYQKLQNPNIYLQKKRNRFRYQTSLILCLILGFAIIQKAWAQRTFTSNIKNNNQNTWHDPNAWSVTGPGSNTTPTLNDIVIIDNSQEMFVTQTAECASLEVRSTGTKNGRSILNIGNSTLKTGAVTINGGNKGSAVQIGGGRLEVNGNLDFVPGSAALEFTGGGTLQITGTLDNDGSFNSGTNSTVIFNGSAAQIIPINYSYANIKTSNSAGVTPSDNMTATSITGDFIVETGIFNNGGFSITGSTGKNFQVNSGATVIAIGTSSFPSFSSYNLMPGSTVRYAGSNQAVAAVPYSNLIIEGSGTKTLSNNITTTGNISVEAGTFNNGGFSITGTTGTMFVIQNGATFTASGISSFPSFPTYNLIPGCTVRYSGSNQTVQAGWYRNLIIEGSGTKTLSGNVTATGNISVEASTLDNGGFNIAEAGASPGNFQVKSGATFIASGSSSFPYFTAINLMPGSTVRYAGSNQAVAALPYSNLIIEGSGTKTLSGNIITTGNISVEAGMFNNGGFGITGATNTMFVIQNGATFIASGTSSFPSFPAYNLISGCTVRYSGSNQTVQAGWYRNLIIEGSGTKTLSGNVTATGNISVEASTLDNGGFNIAEAGASPGNFQVKSGATFIASGTSSFPYFTAINLMPGSTVRYSGSNQAVAAVPYSNLIIEGSGTKTLSGNITTTGNISVEAGTFDNNGFIVQGTGSAQRNFEVKTGATFIASDSKSLPSDFTNTILALNSTVNYKGNGSNQMIAPAIYGNLILSGSSTKTLSGPITITKELDLSNSGLILANHDLTVKQTGSFKGYSHYNYIKQTGTGKLIIENLGTGGITSEKIFPIGTATSFTPAYIQNSGTKSNFSVHVTDGIKDNSGQFVTDNVVRKTWDVKEEPYNTGTANITLKLQWNAVDEGNYFLRSNSGIFHYTGGEWVRPPLSSFSDATNTLTASLSGISTFSPFGVSNQFSPLPVELISFTATKKDNAAYLQWATASEKNNEGFHIQTSADGKNFETIGFVASRNPNSATQQQYDFLDKANTQTGLRYYRLKQKDFDGTVAYSGIKVVNFELRKTAPLVYPNPFSEIINVSIDADKEETLTYQILDLTGKTVYENAQKLIKGNNKIQINLDKKYPAGFYLLRTNTSSGITSSRLIKQ